jgi:hypothetical protein
LLVSPLLPVESVLDETHSRQWITVFEVDLVTSEVIFTNCCLLLQAAALMQLVF